MNRTPAGSDHGGDLWSISRISHGGTQPSQWRLAYLAPDVARHAGRIDSTPDPPQARPSHSGRVHRNRAPANGRAHSVDVISSRRDVLQRWHHTCSSWPSSAISPKVETGSGRVRPPVRLLVIAPFRLPMSIAPHPSDRIPCLWPSP